MKIVHPLFGVSPTSTQSCCLRRIYSLVLCFCACLTQLGYSQAAMNIPILTFGFAHVNQTNAVDYLVETSGVRKYSEWQNPPTTYWGPSQNNVEGALVYRFPLPQPAGSFYLKANDSSWDFNNEPGGFGRGCSALEVSRDGVNWIVLRNSLDSRQWGVDWSYEGDLPPEMIGATEVWLRLRFLFEVATNSSYTVTQFGRSSSAATVNVFDFRAYPVLDSDDDGLLDIHETQTGIFVSATDTGSDPYDSDSSDDGLLDGDVVTAGFDPNTSYTPLFNLVKSKSAGDQARIGLFTESAMIDLNLGGIVLRKSGSTVNLRLQIQSKTDLKAPHWTDEGTETFILDMPGNKAFMRIRALGPQ